MEHRREWLEMQDGTRIAARLFLPDEVPAARAAAATCPEHRRQTTRADLAPTRWDTQHPINIGSANGRLT